MLVCEYLDEWCDNFLPTALAAVGFGDNGRHGKTGFNKGSKGSEAKLVSPKEYYCF